MRIACPFCGDRDAREFTYRGDASPQRPEGGEGMYDYVYVRDNPAGPIRELWYHTQGCRQWLEVTRDTRNHAIESVELADGDKA